MSSIKKIACNPPAEAAARSSDLEVEGCFVGLRELIGVLREAGRKADADDVTHATVEAEIGYRETRRRARAAVYRVFDEMVEKYAQ
ncbi:MAG TPA: hypothetical protein DEH78_19095 [Solibacterales bacterium]|nr:hypothetical protein [Bryobacterales bacterium]